jgi:hypothetical protein
MRKIENFNTSNSQKGTEMKAYQQTVENY